MNIVWDLISGAGAGVPSPLGILSGKPYASGENIQDWCQIVSGILNVYSGEGRAKQSRRINGTARRRGVKPERPHLFPEHQAPDVEIVSPGTLPSQDIEMPQQTSANPETRRHHPPPNANHPEGSVPPAPANLKPTSYPSAKSKFSPYSAKMLKSGLCDLFLQFYSF